MYLESQKFYTRCVAGGEIVDLGGILSASCGGPWAGLNLGFISQPVRSAERLLPRVERALQHFRARGWPWLLVVPDGWVAPDRQEDIRALLEGLNFQLAMTSPAAVSDRLRHPDDGPLDIRLAVNEEDWAAITTVNAEAWSVPAGWVRPLLESKDFQRAARGWVGWLEGSPVGAMVTLPVLGYTYFAWGATMPGYRKHGFGSQMMRYAAAHEDSDRPMLAMVSTRGLRAYEDAGLVPREYFRLYLAPG